MQQVELALGTRLELLEGAVAGPLGDHAQAHLFEDDARAPGVAADVVVAQQGDVVRRAFEIRVLFRSGVQHPVADTIVGDVVAKRLRHTTETLTAIGYHRLAEFRGLFLGNRLDIVADQPDRTF